MSLPARITSLARRDAMTVVGLSLTAGWLLLIVLFWLMGPEGQGGASGIARLAGAMGIILPVALIWIAVALSRAITVLRSEAADLRHKIALMRDEGPRPRPTSTDLPKDGPARASQTVPRLATGPATRKIPARSADGAVLGHQGRTPAPAIPRESVAISPETLIRALNFPDGADDHEAIAALRVALKDRDSARTLRAAQDIVTLLSARDVYMDNLSLRATTPAIWRHFAQGERGSAIGALGDIGDGTALDITAHLLQQDEVFRDAAHHFLRHFDALLTRIVPDLDDTQIAVLSETRSARAFMLLGRVAGIFG